MTSRLFGKELELGEDGPKVDIGRLAGEGEKSESVEGKNVSVEDLGFDDLSEEDYEDMVS